jgi:hypothetical protein
MYSQGLKQENATEVRGIDLPPLEIDDAKLAQMGKRPVLKVGEHRFAE